MNFVFRAIFTTILSLQLFAEVAVAAPLISAKALNAQLDQPNLIILEYQSPEYFERAHIPGSVNTDYARWRKTNHDGLGKMLPNKAELENIIGKLGIGNDSEVVVVPIGQGAGDMAAAARIYWTLYVAGLDKLSILDGGLVEYYKLFGLKGLQQDAGDRVKPREFTAHLRSEEIMDIDKVASYVESGISIVDARSPEEYSGKVAGSKNERPGALQNALNLPYESLFNHAQNKLFSADQLENKFTELGVPIKGDQLSYCHTGHRTSLVWFVAHEVLGNKQARLYDGSTLEWASTTDRPLVLH